MDESANLLVVDGDPGARTATAAVFRGLGHRVVEVGGCHEAIDVAIDRPVDLALLEVDLPDGDGYWLAHRLRDTDDPAIVFLTDADQLQDELAGFEAGADDYISKTVPVSKLIAHVAAVLRRTHATARVWRMGDLVIDESSGAVTQAGSPIASLLPSCACWLSSHATRA
jgi:two-component system OmpR family response regulator